MSAHDAPHVANMRAEALGSTTILVCKPSKSAAATTAPEAMRHTMTLLLPTAVRAMMWLPSWEKASATRESSSARACSTATHVKLELLSNWSLNCRTKMRGGDVPENPSQYASSPLSWWCAMHCTLLPRPWMNMAVEDATVAMRRPLPQTLAYTELEEIVSAGGTRADRQRAGGGGGGGVGTCSGATNP
jgi:hypothetical protein